jgi:hypothetical protein
MVQSIVMRGLTYISGFSAFQTTFEPNPNIQQSAMRSTKAPTLHPIFADGLHFMLFPQLGQIS